MAGPVDHNAFERSCRRQGILQISNERISVFVDGKYRKIRKIQKNEKSLKKVLTTIKSCDRIHLVAEVIRKRQTSK